MKLKNYALMAEIVGAAGVILSLVFVGIQIKGNSDILAAQVVFDLRESNSLMVRDLVTNPELGELVYRGHLDYESLTDEEIPRYTLWVGEVLTRRLTAWKYAEEGLLEAEEIEVWQNHTCQFLTLPGPSKVWSQDGAWFRPDFRASVDQYCSKRTWDVPPALRK